MHPCLCAVHNSKTESTVGLLTRSQYLSGLHHAFSGPWSPPSHPQLSSYSPLTETDVAKIPLSTGPTALTLTLLISYTSVTSASVHTHSKHNSITIQTIPTSFKQAQVTPLLKKTNTSPLSGQNLLNKGGWLFMPLLCK